MFGIVCHCMAVSKRSKLSFSNIVRIIKCIARKVSTHNLLPAFRSRRQRCKFYPNIPLQFPRVADIETLNERCQNKTYFWATFFYTFFIEMNSYHRVRTGACFPVNVSFHQNAKYRAGRHFVIFQGDEAFIKQR